jgi:molecular chaperone HtpG
VPDKATVTKEYSPSELLREEAAFLARVLSTLSEDYLLADAVVQLAEITHGVSVKIEKDSGPLYIWIARDNSAIKHVMQAYHSAYEVFGGFVKDYVRNHIYPSISKHVPSSTREGLDALTRVLQRNREMYRYEESELGDIEPLLGDYLAGEISLSQVLSKARSTGRPATQTVNQDQVGTVEDAIPDVVQSPDAAPPSLNQEYSAAPPILRTDTSCASKILTTKTQHPHLNNFTMLLGLSERITKTQGDFFHYPHTTKIIWAGHRIVYIFSDETGNIALYYDIELREPLEGQSASGGMFPTTTLVLKNRIYVPVPELLEPAFRPVDGAKEFFVRFDLIVAPSEAT